MRKKFNLTIEVKTKSCKFDELCAGDLFTLEGDVGFGNIWIGFPIYCILDSTIGKAVNLTSDTIKYFGEEDEVLPIKLGSVEKPTE